MDCGETMIGGVERLCMVLEDAARPGVFHGWTTVHTHVKNSRPEMHFISARLAAVVELEDGHLELVDPMKLIFLDDRVKRAVENYTNGK